MTTNQLAQDMTLGHSRHLAPSVSTGQAEAVARLSCSLLKLVVTDVDGCLIEGEKAPYDFEALAALRELNQAATPTNAIPYVTLCSGRPYPYVEAMIKLIGGRLPGIFEHGCGLYFPQRELRHECVYHPRALLAEEQRQQWEALVRRIVEETGAGRQCAKAALVTFFPPPDWPTAAFAEYVAAQIAEAGLPLGVGHTVTSVDVMPQGINKFSGLQWLLDELRAEGWEIDLVQVVAVGDSPSDRCFMEPAGFSAAPANAHPQVKAIADYVSPQPYTRGLLDIIRQVVRINEAGGRNVTR